MTESLCYTAEIGITLWINYTLKKNKRLRKVKTGFLWATGLGWWNMGQGMDVFIGRPSPLFDTLKYVHNLTWWDLNGQ